MTRPRLATVVGNERREAVRMNEPVDRLSIFHAVERRNVHEPRRGMVVAKLPAAQIFKLVRNLIGIEGQTVFVRIVVLVRLGRKIHTDYILLSQVAVSMPDAGRNVKEPAIIFGKNEIGDLIYCGRARARVKEDDLHFSSENEVTVLMFFVKAPALHHAGPKRKHIDKNKRIGMPLPARIKHFANTPPRIQMRDCWTKVDARGQRN